MKIDSLSLMLIIVSVIAIITDSNNFLFKLLSIIFLMIGIKIINKVKI